jgi:aspartyl/asparaginyl beta-hydroxylase (cupin superfamily)
MAADSISRLNEFVELAHRAMASRRFDEAARFWETVVAMAPEHPEALFFLGQHALQGRDMGRARQYLARAMRASPDNPSIPLNLSFAARAAGDAKEELAALTAALTIDPYFFPALLSKGALLERTGQTRLAALEYKKLLGVLPPPGKIPKEMEAAIAHAREVVAKNAEQLETALREKLAGLRQKHAGASLERFDECNDVALGLKKVYTQRPLVLHYPGLPAIQFYEHDAFPCLRALEAEIDTIREEVLSLFDEARSDFKPYLNRAKDLPVGHSELNNSTRWSAYYLWKDGQRIDDHCARCPRTAELLEQVGMADMPGYAPTAFFSVLEPHTTIAAHTGATNVRLIGHIPLIIPDRCGFRVGNDVRDWKAGRGWVFDDTIEHEAWNDSNEDRVILIFDVWNPFLSEAERELVVELLKGIDDFYRTS